MLKDPRWSKIGGRFGLSGRSGCPLGSGSGRKDVDRGPESGEVKDCDGQPLHGADQRARTTPTRTELDGTCIYFQFLEDIT